MSRKNRGGDSSSTIFLIVAIVAIIISLGVIAVGIMYAVDSAKVTKEYTEIQATVIDIVEVRVRDSEYGGYKTLYSEIVEYTVDGETYTKQNTSASNAPKSIGSKLKELYNPDNTDECEFKGGVVLAPILMFVLGGIFGIVGVVVLRNYIKSRAA